MTEKTYPTLAFIKGEGTEFKEVKTAFSSQQ